MQRTRTTLWTLCEINSDYLLHPLGDGQCLPRWGWGYLAQEMTALRYGTGFTPVGEQAVVAETDKPCRQDMEQLCGEAHYVARETEGTRSPALCGNSSPHSGS
jgi:hypothetical protein